MTVEISWSDQPRAELRWLFELAEDSQEQLDAYLDRGRVLVASVDGVAVGHLQLVASDDPQAVEIKSMAVAEERQGTGIGRSLVAAAVSDARSGGRRTVLVATAAADIGNLRFYQRVGFRLLSVERDAFTPATGYPDPIDIDGIMALRIEVVCGTYRCRKLPRCLALTSDPSERAGDLERDAVAVGAAL